MRITIRRGEAMYTALVKNDMEVGLKNATLSRHLTKALESLFGEVCKVEVAFEEDIRE